VCSEPFISSLAETFKKVFLNVNKNKDSALIKHNCEHFLLAGRKKNVSSSGTLNGKAVMLGTFV